jgi:hypothetical protein
MTYKEQMQRIVREYIDAGQLWPASAHDIAIWAIANHRWEPQHAAMIRKCAEELSDAMREEYFTDPQGRRVRAKHVAKYDQTSLWADIRNASRDHMELALQQRRQQILGDCKQLKVDVDSYNDNQNTGEPIQMVFDFTYDLEELELARMTA